ncbi:hypothetical protein CEE37_03350 [candidate division LCP-89 bacterium B3_LCP]|uniref:Glycosyltransferase subfamily 4-like N-terminal domain-containing protein n=1 Tax=candidate division LCP-89 bacterium B3_LCP TaxID=2012998 RepID=A0A532V352_UNCL8|nr:MAG: hypothetical protein CEE37_03350 [candidate division LCP-89 bacterium B3_LCP]
MIDPLKIAMVAACPFPTSQGSQVLIRELSQALVKRGHDVHVVTYHFGEDQECPDLKIHRIPKLIRYNKFRSGPALRKPILDLLLAWKLNQVVRDEKIQIIHCHNYEAPVSALPVRLFRKIPVVYHSHNTMSDEFYTYFRLKFPQKLAKYAAYLMDRFIPRSSDFAIAINRRVAKFLMDMGMPPSRVKFIPPGIDYGLPVDAPDPDLREKYGMGSGPLIVYAGNLDGYQRLDLLLEALSEVFRENQHARLIVMSSSDPGPFLRDANKNGISEKIVILKDPAFALIREVMALATLAVNPRISWSGYPIKLLNYMAAGLPVVAFEGAAPAIEDGINGALAPPLDTRAFAYKINNLLRQSHLAAKLGEEAMRTAVYDHDWNEIVEDIEDIYAKLLGLGIVSPSSKSFSDKRLMTAG